MKPPKKLVPLDGHHGFVPPRYAAGRRTADALLESGRRLLRATTLESLTIQELCAGASVTTGAFYGRFQGKDVYFKALQALAIYDISRGIEQRLAEFDAREWTLEEAARAMVHGLRKWVLRQEGVLRASQAQRTGNSASWDPFRRASEEYVDRMVSRIARMLGMRGSPRLDLRIRFAFQMMISTIVNAALNKPGPLPLSDKRMDEEMARAFCAYLRSGEA